MLREFERLFSIFVAPDQGRFNPQAIETQRVQLSRLMEQVDSIKRLLDTPHGTAQLLLSGAWGNEHELLYAPALESLFSLRLHISRELQTNETGARHVDCQLIFGHDSQARSSQRLTCGMRIAAGKQGPVVSFYGKSQDGCQREPKPFLSFEISGVDHELSVYDDGETTSLPLLKACLKVDQLGLFNGYTIESQPTPTVLGNLEQVYVNAPDSMSLEQYFMAYLRSHQPNPGPYDSGQD